MRSRTLRRGAYLQKQCPQFIGLVILLLATSREALGQTVVYIVRHAEKASETGDSPLSPQGKQRAEALAELLKRANIKAIYTSEALRTIETAAPLAGKLGIDSVPVTGDYATKTFDAVRNNNAADAVLIVGHSTTVGPILQKWAPDALAAEITIAGNEYDAIFVVTPSTQAGQSAGWTRLKYGP
jgi:phosphohistidine phosphatase SixA